MLFSSYAFLFGFLPIALLAYYIPALWGKRMSALAALTAASLVFYGWGGLSNLALLMLSITLNFLAAAQIARLDDARARWTGLVVMIALNLAGIAYYKYLPFLTSIANDVGGFGFAMESVALPIGISFYTFVQITYLVDIYRRVPAEKSFLRYGLFVTFFPHLIAGPIIHHTDLLPQFAREFQRRQATALATAGIMIFAIGLFKKVVLADSIAPLADAVFDGAGSGTNPSMLDAWLGTLAYTLQLYFDFSGYSDMAIGLAGMFGVRLPLNFFSPYKSENISEFWRRWHMTLSRFLREYVYIPLGGNRRGRSRRYANLLVTMVLGGLWHGAGWNFLAWGALHGAYLVVHQLCRRLSHPVLPEFARLPRAVSIAITFVAVMLAWVLFRAPTWSAALTMYGAMIDTRSLTTTVYLSELAPGSRLSALVEVFPAGGVTALIVALATLLIFAAMVFALPNTAQFMATRDTASHDPELSDLRMASSIRWRANAVYGMFAAVLVLISLLCLWPVKSNPPFLYFNF